MNIILSQTFIENSYYFGYVSIWGFIILAILISLLGLEVGYRLGVRVYLSSEGETKPPMETLIGTMLGLLAFILAFTFGAAGNHFDQRRQVILEEANAIGTTYLRAGYLVEPYKTNMRKLLIEYVTVRLDAVRTKNIQEAVEKSDIIQKGLWDQVVQFVDKGHKTNLEGLVVQSLNDVIDLHAKRIAVLYGMRIPSEIWLILFIVMVLSFGVIGYLSGLKNSRNLQVNIWVVLAFASILFLIVDLDYPHEGYIKVSQQPLIDTLHMMEKG